MAILKKPIIFIFIMIAAGAGFSGCASKLRMTNNELRIDGQETGQAEESVENGQNSTATTSANGIQEIVTTTKEWQGQSKMIEENDGWKKYVNNYLGMEFRFQDKKNEITVTETGDSSIRIRSIDEKLWMYIDVFCFRPDNKSLFDYISEYWDDYQEEAKLISIKKLKNKNGQDFVVKTVIVSGGMQSPGKKYELKEYYTDYENEIIEKRHAGYKERCYVNIHGNHKNSVFQDIVNSFKLNGQL